MNTVKYLGSLLATAFVAATSLTGCMVEAGFDPGVVIVDQSSSITVDWTIDGRDGPFVCADFGVDAVDVEIYDGFGELVRATRTPCEFFSATMYVPAGEFSVDATLVDAFDDALSTTATAPRLLVDRDADVLVDLDFPADSML